MIPPKLLGYGLAAIAALSLISLAAYKLYNAGRDSVQVKWDAERAIQQAALDKATAETARVENERRKLAQRIDNELQPKLEAVTRDAESLARRLRLAARSTSSPVSEAAGTSGILDGTSGGGSRSCTFTDGVGQALEDYFGASARDSERLNAWISFYRQLQETQDRVE